MLSLLATLLLFTAMMTLLLFRAIAAPEPQCSLRVRGNPAWLGAKVSVAKPGDGDALHLAQIGKSEFHSVTFFVPHAAYVVEVAYHGGPVLLRREIDLRDTNEAVVYLPMAQSASGPAPMQAR
jgi:hypothetical protein